MHIYLLTVRYTISYTNSLHLQYFLDHLHNIEVALLLPLVDVLFQHIYLTLLSLHVSLVTGIAGLAPVCSVEFLPLVTGLVPMYSVEFPPLSSLPLQCL